MVSKRRDALLSSRRDNRDQQTREKPRKYAISGVFLCPKPFVVVCPDLTISDVKKVVKKWGTGPF